MSLPDLSYCLQATHEREFFRRQDYYPTNLKGRQTKSINQMARVLSDSTITI